MAITEFCLWSPSDHGFNSADGIITNLKYDNEVAFLEIYGSYGTQNSDKEIKDCFKASYGLLAMIHTVSRKYQYTDDENIFMYSSPLEPSIQSSVHD
ncbi:unnamed protein product [Rhizopus stolonifer]